MGHSGQGGGRAGEPVGRRALLGRPSAPGARLRQAGSWMEEEEEEEKEAGATQREERAREQCSEVREGPLVCRRVAPGSAQRVPSTVARITVSPQHPCEVGWKVATTVNAHFIDASWRASGQDTEVGGWACARGSPRPHRSRGDPPLAARDSHRAQEPRSWASKEGDQKNKTQKSTAGGD